MDRFLKYETVVEGLVKCRCRQIAGTQEEEQMSMQKESLNAKGLRTGYKQRKIYADNGEDKGTHDQYEGSFVVEEIITMPSIEHTNASLVRARRPSCFCARRMPTHARTIVACGTPCSRVMGGRRTARMGKGKKGKKSVRSKSVLERISRIIDSGTHQRPSR
ncbi:hypothetical protein K438DRAFT_1761365 [Mycena galopus ATCC 62051]|nr:hypothetical protein K438DRAFT_1761365 [Mycena galopus ATCC 62051]